MRTFEMSFKNNQFLFHQFWPLKKYRSVQKVKDPVVEYNLKLSKMT